MYIFSSLNKYLEFHHHYHHHHHLRHRYYYYYYWYYYYYYYYACKWQKYHFFFSFIKRPTFLLQTLVKTSARQQGPFPYFRQMCSTFRQLRSYFRQLRSCFRQLNCAFPFCVCWKIQANHSGHLLIDARTVELSTTVHLMAKS